MSGETGEDSSRFRGGEARGKGGSRERTTGGESDEARRVLGDWRQGAQEVFEDFVCRLHEWAHDPQIAAEATQEDGWQSRCRGDIREG